jgi:hypothetical protein
METSTGASVGSGLVVLAAKASGKSKACPLPKARPSCAAVGLGELKDALTRFELWYNQQRPHSALDYELLWTQLIASVPKARLAS